MGADRMDCSAQVYPPATRRTMYFIGVSTGQSSIMRIFPRWAEALGLDAVLVGIDFPLDSPPARYREAVEFIKADPLSLGALVTTHKVNLLKASRDLFDELDPLALRLGEVSCISKRATRLCGHAKDPITVGFALAAIVEANPRAGPAGKCSFSALAAPRWPSRSSFTIASMRAKTFLESSLLPRWTSAASMTFARSSRAMASRSRLSTP